MTSIIGQKAVGYTPKMLLTQQTLNLPPSILNIFIFFEKIEIPAWLAGGCLRDLLLGKLPHDWDFATPLSPEEVQTRLEMGGAQVRPTGVAHGTLTFHFQGQDYEITTFRKDGPYLDHRHPEWVSFTGDLFEDLSRRDFSINALAYAPEKGLADPYNGQADLIAKVIRCVGDPCERFQEDALRILRGVRLAAQLGFAIENETALAMQVQAPLLFKISAERIRDELNKMLLSDHVALAFDLLKAINLWPYILPEMVASLDHPQHSDHHYLDIYQHIKTTVSKTPRILAVRLGALFHDIGKPATFTLDERGKGHFYGHHKVGMIMAKQAMERLRYSRSLERQVLFLIKYHMLHLTQARTITLKRFLSQVPEPFEENLDNLFALMEADLKASANPHLSLNRLEEFKNKCREILRSGEPLTLKELALNGHDLVTLGIPERQRSLLLHQLLTLILEDPNLNTREYLLAEAQSRVQEMKASPKA